MSYLDELSGNREIKEMARKLNEYKKQIEEIQHELVNPRVLDDTRPNSEVIPYHMHVDVTNPIIAGTTASELDLEDLDDVTPTTGDHFLIEDNSDSNNRKSVLFETLEGALDHDALTNFVANEHLDWTSDLGATNIDVNNITETAVTQHEAAIDHDALTNFVANEHLDWTSDQGATNIHVNNITAAAVTQHQASLSITESQISDLQAYLVNLIEDTTPQLGGELDAQGNNIIDLADITFRTGVTGGTIRTGTSAADKFVLQGYDVDGAAYVDVLEVDAGNTVVMDLFATATIGGAQIVGAGGAYHDGFSDFVANEHLDWTSDLGATNIHVNNITASAVTQHQASIDHDSLSGFVANEHLDWSADQGATNIHVNNITASAVTQHQASIDHDSLSGFVAAEHEALNNEDFITAAISSIVIRYDAAACFAYSGDTAHVVAHVGVYDGGTGSSWLYFILNPPKWLIQYAATNSLTITATIIDVIWQNNDNNSYINRIIAYHRDVSGHSGTSKKDTFPTTYGQGNTTDDNCQVDFTDFAVAEGDALVMRIESQNNSAADTRIYAFDLTFTLA